LFIFSSNFIITQSVFKCTVMRLFFFEISALRLVMEYNTHFSQTIDISVGQNGLKKVPVGLNFEKHYLKQRI